MQAMMKRWLQFLLISALMFVLSGAAAWKDIQNVVVIVLENTSVDQAMKQPFLSELARKGAFLSNYYAVAHPSQPNYLAMVGGSTFGTRTDNNVTVKGQHIGDLLEKVGRTWKVYAEDYVGNCFLEAQKGPYVRKHTPFLSFLQVQTQPAECSHIVNAAEFDKDRLTVNLPAYAFYVPNLNNDGHDTGAKYADNWLSNTFSKTFSDEQIMKHALFVIVFDEDDYNGDNRVYAAFVGAGVKAGVESKHRYDHYSLLKTVEAIFQVGSLNKGDKTAEVISDIWMP